jgi:hypothetical protein
MIFIRRAQSLSLLVLHLKTEVPLGWIHKRENDCSVLPRQAIIQQKSCVSYQPHLETVELEVASLTISELEAKFVFSFTLGVVTIITS